MCTISIIPFGRNAYSVGFCRDELRSRGREHPPEIVELGARRAVHPTDADAGGSWLAANDAGLVIAVLNRNEPGLPDRGALGASRGSLVLALAAAGTLDDAESQLAASAPKVERPYRLVATDGRGVLEALGAAGEVSCMRLALDGPFTRASSGLGDELVRGPRGALFEQLVAGAPDDARRAAQRAFHAHCWPDQRHLSVCMDRAEARTVSRSFVEVGPDAIEFRHERRAPTPTESPDGAPFEREAVRILARAPRAGRSTSS
jgi:hypothetical protein